MECALCPIKHGAFKRTAEPPSAWVHMVCALWHEGTAVRPGNVCEAVEGVRAIKAERVGGQCGICKLSHGSVIKCNYGHCQFFFHPLCGRRVGHYVTAKIGSSGKIVHRAYCGQHSEMCRNKDLESGAVRVCAGGRAGGPVCTRACMT